MNYDAISNIFYIIASIFFIIGLKMLSKAETAKKGNFVSAIGMFIAVVTAVVFQLQLQYIWVVIGMLIGGIIGIIGARKVEMTSMPEMVALFNGFGGIASLLVAYSEYQKYVSMSVWLTGMPFSQIFIIIVTIFIGGITFTGSIVAFLKLSGKISSKAIIYKGQRIVNILLLLVIIGCTIFISSGTISINIQYPIFLMICSLSMLVGITFVVPIGGGDMPVVISLLNACSGIAASVAGFAISNTVLIVTGALVGSSGIILTNIMCRSMNRSLPNVLFSGFGSITNSKNQNSVEGEVKPVSVEDTYLMLEAASSVLIVPGYGMAVGQAQHAVFELASLLEENGCDVSFAIHPVAGRMPGHMNVLLAEANVPYEQLLEMDDVNPTIDQVDVCVVIGANDVVNPAARSDESSPIYGMPIINVDFARTVIVLKRSMNAGFAGIDNPLFYNENTRMLFGDAKKTVQEVVAEFKG